MTKHQRSSETGGLATFLMTDIEGSTRLWEEAPNAMQAALEAHDTILRAAVGTAGGDVIKTTGDGVLARFDEPSAAVAAALDGQRALSAHGWPDDAVVRARMAVHSGSAQARGGDFFGPALNRVARLLAIGRGGQVLLSGITAALVAERLPDEATLIDLGEQRLRDVDAPVRVYQLAAPGLTRQFASLRTAGSGRTNLPIQLTSFVGRERERAGVIRLLSSNRLVTLIGTGGTGKTRLMLEVAGDLVDAYPDGVWLAELAPIIDPAMVVGAVAQAVGVREPPGVTTEAALADYVRAKAMLLLIDNCEHVIGPAAAVAASLLEVAPQLKIVTTGREALGIAGEAIIQVPSLIGVESLRLFSERATAVSPSFQLGSANEKTVKEICRRLDGIPLAIELAAARVSVLSVDEILERLSDRFRLLTGGRRTAVPRQQTLQALIDWSWDLLGDPDRQLLRRLSVFAGGWTLDAASAIAGEPGADTLSVLDVLTHLVDRSLVVADPGPTTRYRLGETIRQYGRDRLIESGEAEATRTRHLTYFVDLAERAEREMQGPALVDWLQRLDADADNLRVAIEWGLESDTEAAIRLCTALWEYWRARPSAAVDAETWFERAVDVVAELPMPATGREPERQVLVARLYAVTAFTGALRLGRDMRALADAGVTLARASGDPWTLAFALGAAWTARVFAGASEGIRELAEESIRVAAQAGDHSTEATAAAGLAGAISLGGSGPEIDRALALLDHAARLARSVGDPLIMAFIALTRGRMDGVAGRLPEARAAFQAAAALYTEIGDPLFALIAESDLGHAARRSGELGEATSILRRTMPEWVRTGSRGAIANQLESFAMVAIERGDPDRAGRLFGAAEALREAARAAMLPFERVEYDAVVERLRSGPDSSVVGAAWAAGRAMEVDTAVAYALEV